MSDQQVQKLRLTVQQPALAKYRVPVFRELASRPEIDLRLIYAERPGIPNVEPAGFKAEFVPMSSRRVLGRTLLWHPPQLDEATRERSDVLSLSWDLHYASLVPALLKARRQGVGTILWGHGVSKNEAGWRARLRQRVGHLADVLLFYTHVAADAYIAAGFDPSRVFVALNTIDQAPIQEARSQWAGRESAIESFRREQQLGSSPVVLFVARLEEPRRVELLLRAQSKLAATVPDLVVAIVGKGPDEPRLRGIAEELGIADRVRFLGAIYDEKLLAPWFAVSSLFCFPSCIGLSILHAMGYGLPVITGDQVELHGPEIVALEDGVNGLFFREGDDEDLTSKLARLLGDPARLARMSSAAHATATQRFSLANMIDGYVAATVKAHELASKRGRSD